MSTWRSPNHRIIFCILDIAHIELSLSHPSMVEHRINPTRPTQPRNPSAAQTQNKPVAAISEWSDDQPQSVAEIFITVFQFRVDHPRLQISILPVTIYAFTCSSIVQKLYKCRKGVETDGVYL